MSRRTKKHHLDTFAWDTKYHSWDVMIYSSGGSTHTAYVEVIDDMSRVVERYDMTFTGNDARARIYEWVRQQRDYSLLPDSKWMKDKPAVIVTYKLRGNDVPDFGMGKGVVAEEIFDMPAKKMDSDALYARVRNAAYSHLGRYIEVAIKLPDGLDEQ